MEKYYLRRLQKLIEEHGLDNAIAMLGPLSSAHVNLALTEGYLTVPLIQRLQDLGERKRGRRNSFEVRATPQDVARQVAKYFEQEEILELIDVLAPLTW